MADHENAEKLNSETAAPGVSASTEQPENVTAGTTENVTATAENVPDICSPVIDVAAVTQRAEPFILATAETWGIDDLVKHCKQAQWSALMIAAGKHLFPVRPLDNLYLYNPYTGEPYTRKPYQYNDTAIDILADYYIALCMRYAKLVAVLDFEYFCNVPFQAFEKWGFGDANSRDQVTRKRWRIAQKLKRARHESLKQRAADNGNVTGVIFVANSEYADASPAVQRERAALTARELPRLQAMPGSSGGAVLLPGGGQ